MLLAVLPGIPLKPTCCQGTRYAHIAVVLLLQMNCTWLMHVQFFGHIGRYYAAALWTPGLWGLCTAGSHAGSKFFVGLSDDDPCRKIGFHFANAGQKLIASATAEPGAFAQEDYFCALHHTQSLLFLSLQFVCRQL